MHCVHLLIIVIGALTGALTYAQDEVSDDGGSLHPGMVLVEPSPVIASQEGGFELRPYSERRRNWGTTFSVLYSTFDPIHYDTRYVPGKFGDVYGAAMVPMLELDFGVKRNLSWGSVGLEISGGGYQNHSAHTDVVDSTLQLFPVHIGLTVALERLFSQEPYAVPYLSAGAYYMNFKESLGGTSFNGNTQLAPYFNGGVAVSLDWVDRRGARMAYEEAQVQSTYLLLEVRKQLASSQAHDPDFSNDVSFGAGLRVEF